MREVYFQQKDPFYLAQVLIGMIVLLLYIFYPEVKGLALDIESKLIAIPFLLIIVIIFPVVLIISDNYYVHVFNMILVLMSFTGQIINDAITMK